MSTRILETTERYYKIILTRDLLGDLVVMCFWGGKENSRGGCRSVMVSDVEAGEKLIQDIIKKRRKRGYYEIFYSVDLPLAQKVIHRPAILKKSDQLNPQKYLQMLSRCQNAVPELFADKKVTLHQFTAQVQNQFPEYSHEPFKAMADNSNFYG